jgi:hypoxanthine phosphoribosyltransferase
MSKERFFPDFWFALDRGGVIPAATIRRLLQEIVPDLKSLCSDLFYVLPKGTNTVPGIRGLYVPFSSFDYTNSKVIIIDDICDSGFQFSNIDKDSFEGAEDVKFCSLIHNVSNQYNVDVQYYGSKIDKKNKIEDNGWYQFWWEFDSLPFLQNNILAK